MPHGEEAVKLFISCNDHDTLLLFSDRGVSYALPAYRVPQCSRTAKGTPVVQLLPIPREEAITSLLAVSEFNDDTDLLMLTSGGFIKRTRLSAFSNIRSNGLIAINLEEGDALTWVRLAVPGDSVLIGSRAGMTIHFRLSDEELRPLGQKVFYTTPLKALSNQKLRDFREQFGADNVGLMTGDLSVNREADALLS